MVQMFRLTDLENDQDIGVITEDQLQFLIDNLEEEGIEEQDYYIDEDTLSFLAANDCDAELLAMLTEALEGRRSIDIRYEMV
jgi:processive 1,2-diacylglycerol beta-glucosyltransferase